MNIDTESAITEISHLTLMTKSSLFLGLVLTTLDLFTGAFPV